MLNCTGSKTLKSDFQKWTLKYKDNADLLWQEYLEAIPANIGALKEGSISSLPIRKPGKRHVPSFTIDLHGLTCLQAEAETLRVIKGLLQTQTGGPFTLKVITGRGLHSGEGGSVLVREIYRFIHTTFRASILKIDPPPAESTLNGLPLRGFFLVQLAANKR
jgi:hypothetical protein